MSSRLTLLFVCDHRELYPVLTSAIESLEFSLLMAGNKEQANRILTEATVDAVLIQQSEPRSGRSICAALKRQAPRTPILLFAAEDQQPEAYPGIYSVLHADAQDEVLARAIAIFLRQCLDSSHTELSVGGGSADNADRIPDVRAAV